MLGAISNGPIMASYLSDSDEAGKVDSHKHHTLFRDSCHRGARSHCTGRES
jgi:hypothetical protein